MKSYVYFIRPIGMIGPIKIGYSKNPVWRVTLMESSSPFALELVAMIEGDVLLERRFQAHFIEQHSRGEWFHWSQELEDTIKQIREGVFDTSVLPEKGRYAPSRTSSCRSRFEMRAA